MKKIEQISGFPKIPLHEWIGCTVRPLEGVENSNANISKTRRVRGLEFFGLVRMLKGLKICILDILT